MSVHHFAWPDEIREFWETGEGYLLNNAKNCLHHTSCETYRYNPPGMNYTRIAFDTASDAAEYLRGMSWYPCPTCRPSLKGGRRTAESGAHKKQASPEPSGHSVTMTLGGQYLDPAAVLRAVKGFDEQYGEMERALAVIADAARTDVLEAKATPVVEGLVWTIRSWWGVQGVSTESKVIAARALAAHEWDSATFDRPDDLPQADAKQAVRHVDALVYEMQERGAHRREYSLASKVLHWLAPWRFPVYDAFVKDSLGVPESWPPSRAYREIVEKEYATARMLMRIDADAWAGEVEPRSPLRALDKYLWWKGGGDAGAAALVKNPWSYVRRLGLGAQMA